MDGSLAEKARLNFHAGVGISPGEEGRGWHWGSDQETVLDLGGSHAELASRHAPSYQNAKVWFLLYACASPVEEGC